jgi:hypothetical protein
MRVTSYFRNVQMRVRINFPKIFLAYLGFASISAQLLVCPKLPFYLAFYLLLLLVCPLGAKELASNCALRRDRCLLIYNVVSTFGA